MKEGMEVRGRRIKGLKENRKEKKRTGQKRKEKSKQEREEEGREKEEGKERGREHEKAWTVQGRAKSAVLSEGESGHRFKEGLTMKCSNSSNKTH